MLRCTATAWLLIALFGAHARATDSPQRAHVASAEAEVRSGPGLQFYATDRLINETEVEIYRQLPNGWCAIRPPEGSFSYVPVDATQATLTSQVVTCAAPGIKTRVGSKLGSQFNVQYVALQVGERLQVLSDPVTLGKDQRSWYRVAPPSGEFRWMRLQDLRIEPAPHPVTQVASADITVEPAEPAPLPPVATDLARPLSALVEGSSMNELPSESGETDEVTASQRLATSAIPAGARGRMETMPIPTPPVAPPVTRVAQTPADSESIPSVDPTVAAEDAIIQPTAHLQAAGDQGLALLAPVSAAQAEQAGNEPESAWTAVPDGAASDPNWALAELELQLSQQVTGDVGSWQLSAITAQASSLMRRANDPEVRSDAQRLLQRTQEFAALQRRHQALLDATQAGGISLVSAVTSVPTSADVAANMSAVSPTPPERMANASRALPRRGSTPLDPHAVARRRTALPITSTRVPHAATPSNAGFIGRGWLVPVITARTDLPRFALTDEKGRVTSFVAAAPGLNLRRYERHEVGIVGKAHTATRRESSYLLAERIVVLDRR